MTEIKVNGLSRDLFPHQCSSVYHLERREQSKKIFTGAMEITTNIGLFSDIGGYGKTLSLIALIVRDRLAWNLDGPYTRASPTYNDVLGAVMVKRFHRVSDAKCNATLVVAIANNIPQWVSELEGSPASFATVTVKQDLDGLAPDEADVVVCSYLLYQSLVARFPRAWKRAIFDNPEAQHIPKMHYLEAGFIWFVGDAAVFSDRFCRRRTASPHFIKTLFGRMPLDIFQSLVVKNNDSYVMRSWPLPSPRHVVHDCDEKVPPNQTFETIETMGGMVKDAGVLSEKETCPICLEDHDSEVIHVKCCGKKIGGNCLVRWFQETTPAETCPHCRHPLLGKDLVYYSGSPRRRTKPRTAANIINSTPNGKFILFSALRETFPAITLDESGIAYAHLQGGSGIADTKTLSRFREGAIKVLSLSAKQPGTGLNLEFATDLILYHEVSPSMEAGLVSRINRAGRGAPPPRIHHLKLA